MTRAKARTCSDCPAEITKWSKTGKCHACAMIAQGAAQRKTLEAPATASNMLDVRGDVATVTKTTNERVKTLADLVRVCDIDTTEWDVVEWRAVVHEMGSVPRTTRDAKSKRWVRPSTEPVVTPLYSVSAKLRRKVAILDARAELAALKADAKASFGRGPALVVKRAVGDGLMLEPHIPDLHVGKLAWGKETGHVDYDGKIAAQLFEDAVDAIIARTAGFKFARVLFPVGNDLLHSDTKQGTTTGGTPLDTDSRYHKNFTTARRLVQRAIERFRAIAPQVDVPLIPGNHDTLSVWHLGDSLECLYHNTPGVTIDNAPAMRKYAQHGRVMLMFAHGNRGKLQEYPLLMAQERPTMWAQTRHREAHTGDKHQLRAQSHRGVIVRISPALCPPDAWHSENLYTGLPRGAEAFVWHREDGLIATANYAVTEPNESIDLLKSA